MNLVQRVQEAFAPGGPLPGAVEQYRPRQGQTDMALAVAQTIQDGGALVVEAGTGVGKTYAYLVPALLSGAPTLISTATKALQDQLFNRDIPHLLRSLGVPLKLALLKGRSSYLCHYRLQQARQSHQLQDSDLQNLARVERWAPSTHSGDLAELDGLDETAALIPLVTSTRDNCLGGSCPQAGVCHVNRARRQALAADLVVVNHHLFFADWQVRESGVAELLPSVRTVVFDEAHQLHEIGVQFLGSQFSTGQLDLLAADLERSGAELAAGLAPWRSWGETLRGLASLLRRCVGGKAAGRHLLDQLDGLGESDGQALRNALAGCQTEMAAIAVAIEPLAGHHPELEALARRLTDAANRLQALTLPCPDAVARWIEISEWQVRIFESPLDLAGSLGELVSTTGTAGGKSWIFTSATLGHESTLSWFVKGCGLEGARVLRVESPFDFARQAALYVPQGMVDPQHPDHSAAVAEVAALGAVALGGRTLVLTTSLRAMRQIGELLHGELLHRGIDVLVQGQASKRLLLERFNSAPTGNGQGVVLVASVSFWEGIDVPGDALQLLVIDKLPFAPPEDPLLRARALHLESRGENAFRALHLPQAAVALKQGAGRLIRRETDQGVLVICDIRLRTKPYGRRLLDALPPMRHLAATADYRHALEQITRSSTTGRPSDALPW